MEKEFLYVGYYVDTDGKFVLKIGTTNDLERRAKEHTRNYRRAKRHTMPTDRVFEYLWSLPLSKYNTIRFEDSNRELWKNLGIGEFVRNDRFVLATIPKSVPVKIRKTYEIALSTGERFFSFEIVKFLTGARAVRQIAQTSTRNFVYFAYCILLLDLL
jgi:predicted GIY-YIG superfamily endonuclease